MVEGNKGEWRGQINAHIRPGAAVAERLDCSPPTMANGIQPRSGHSRIFASGNRAGRLPLVGGFSRGSLVSPAPSFWRCSILNLITLIGYQDLDTARLPPKPLLEVGIMPDGAAVRQGVFSGISCIARPLHSGAAPFSHYFTIIGSQELAWRRRDLGARPQHVQGPHAHRAGRERERKREREYRSHRLIQRSAPARRGHSPALGFSRQPATLRRTVGSHSKGCSRSTDEHLMKALLEIYLYLTHSDPTYTIVYIKHEQQGLVMRRSTASASPWKPTFPEVPLGAGRVVSLFTSQADETRNLGLHSEKPVDMVTVERGRGFAPVGVDLRH
ncbi:hypothetical protein PR048_032566 [Dryococelus australis]|uniref:Uncharacterized protein n=1 Tax=Dryococelus australis TaxID=614101 RepID=A0ABQ9G2K9_9NEOP|nr:hypothetical protein PR048_032566 [Dryococelus australis]